MSDSPSKHDKGGRYAKEVTYRYRRDYVPNPKPSGYAACGIAAGWRKPSSPSVNKDPLPDTVAGAVTESVKEDTVFTTEDGKRVREIPPNPPRRLGTRKYTPKVKGKRKRKKKKRKR